MKTTTVALSLCLILAACGGGGRHSSSAGPQGTPDKSAYEIWLEQGNVGTEQDFAAYQAWLADGNSGSYQDYTIIKGPTTPIHSISENNLDNMSFSTLGSREHWNLPVKIHLDDNGNITGIDLLDTHDPDNLRYGGEWFGSNPSTMYNLKPQNGKYQSQTIYYYNLPYKCDNCFYDGFDYIGFGTDKELSLAEVKKTFSAIVANDTSHHRLDEDTKNKVIASIEALSESDKKTTPVCYDMNCRYTDADLGSYFVSQQSLTMDIEAFGRDVGLEFSNFGELRGKYNLGDGYIPRAYVFAGGDDAHLIDKESVEGTMTFSGKAVGQVMYHYSDLSDTSQSYMDVAADARLSFVDGKEEFIANFSDNADSAKRWYDVKITADGDNKTVTLANGDKIAEQNSKYKFDGIDDKEFSFVPSYSEKPGVDAKLNTEYYGNNGTPTEAVATVMLHQQDYDDTYNHEVTLFSSFGALKD